MDTNGRPCLQYILRVDLLILLSRESECRMRSHGGALVVDETHSLFALALCVKVKRSQMFGPLRSDEKWWTMWLEGTTKEIKI